MTLSNRLHTLTRWPADPLERIALADADIGFAVAMTRIVGVRRELNEIAIRAFKVQIAAQNELTRKKHDT